MGQYSVKSAYVHIQNTKVSPSSADDSGFWKKLWKLKIPSKIKNFFWRATSGFLPTKDLLRTRKVNVNELCPICNEAPKTVMHALVSCNFADQCHNLADTTFSSSAQINYNTFAGFISSDDGNEQWHLPPDNSVKINVDATIFEDPRRYSYNFLTRDHSGFLVEAISKCSPGRVTPEFVEALGIREALSWTKMKGYRNVVVETDCL
ncbi:uncharacterized protein LOC141707268 [Apium graveolens]|uniref:uncharacterized protein LOC141707268 n=1 Tax=Apium graveolens TaxID=4045 RepID=UPI003D79E980